MWGDGRRGSEAVDDGRVWGLEELGGNMREGRGGRKLSGWREGVIGESGDVGGRGQWGFPGVAFLQQEVRN